MDFESKAEPTATLSLQRICITLMILQRLENVSLYRKSISANEGEHNLENDEALIPHKISALFDVSTHICCSESNVLLLVSSFVFPLQTRR